MGAGGPSWHVAVWLSCGSDWAPHPLERAAGHATLTACANARAIAVEPRPLGVPRTFIRRNANTDSRRAGVRWRGECILSRHSKFKFTAVDWVPSAVTGDVKGSRTSTRLHLHTHTRLTSSSRILLTSAFRLVPSILKTVVGTPPSRACSKKHGGRGGGVLPPLSIKPFISFHCLFKMV